MNECNKRFLERNGIVIEDICTRIDCHIHSRDEENPIIAQYNFQTNDEREMVSVADIVGYDTFERSQDTNIFLSMDRFFDEKGKPYSTRSLGMLEYDKENIIENLRQSFRDEPISLIETGEGTYAVLSNGLHRYTLLRILYLSEAVQANGNREKLAELAKKYTIPADVTGIDFDKTYCKYLLKHITTEDQEWNITDIYTEYDRNYRATGNCVITYGNGETEVLTNEELLALTKERVFEDEHFKDNYQTLQKMYNKYPSFALFIDEEFSDIIPLQREELSKEGTNKTW